MAALALVALLGWAEWAGWPFLAQPVAHLLSQRLDRTLSFGEGPRPTLRLHLFGGLRLQTDKLVVNAPTWSTLGPTLSAHQVALQLRYIDLIAWRRGAPLRVKRLRADQIALQLERRVDGRASWQFGAGSNTPRQPAERPAFDGLSFDELALTEGEAELNDALARLDLQMRFALRQGSQVAVLTQAAAASRGAQGAPATPPATDARTAPEGLTATAQGRYRDQPLRATLNTGPALAWLSSAADAPAVPVALDLNVGRAELHFQGSVQDLLGRQALEGRYALRGPSLFAVGEPLGLTLPSTAPFSMKGQLDRQGPVWHTVVEDAQVGQSRLRGDFRFTQTPGHTPTLSGRLSGPSLALADLGPAVGLPATGEAASRTRADRVLPQREFNLPSLRAMNADVLVALDRLDLGTQALSNIQPMKAHLLLSNGVLQLRDIDAQVAQGALSGRITLDGREAAAQWNAQLKLKGLKLEDWIRQSRARGTPPYVSGRLGVNLALSGQGRSTAELLGSANGRAIVHWREGTVSHLLTEAAGLDAAQALGVWLSGDGALPVDCGAADLDVKAGTVTPRVMLVDSRDSTLWVDGSLSLATERLALVAHVAPKDISPLALRTPIHLDGTLRSPTLSVEKGPLLRRLVPAALLAMLNPLAALLPLVDTGDDEARSAIETCHRVAARRLDRAAL